MINQNDLDLTSRLISTAITAMVSEKTVEFDVDRWGKTGAFYQVYINELIDRERINKEVEIFVYMTLDAPTGYAFLLINLGENFEVILDKNIESFAEFRSLFRLESIHDLLATVLYTVPYTAR